MKKPNVNLLPTAARFQISQIRLAEKLNKIAFASVIIWFILAGVIFSLRLFLHFQGESLLKQSRSLEASLIQFTPKIELQQALRFRLKLAAEVLKARPLFGEKISRLINLFPEGAEIDSLRIKGGKTEVSGSLFSLVDLDDFEKRVARAEKEGAYLNVKLNSLSQSEREWNFSLELEEKKEF